MGERLEVIVQKQKNGLFGVTFDREEVKEAHQITSQYIIRHLSPSIITDRPILIGDRLLAINGNQEKLEDYSRSDDAKAMTEWNVALYRRKQSPKIRRQKVAGQDIDPPAFRTTDTIPNDLANGVIYTSTPEEIEQHIAATGVGTSQPSQQQNLPKSLMNDIGGRSIPPTVPLQGDHPHPNQKQMQQIPAINSINQPPLRELNRTVLHSTSNPNLSTPIQNYPPPEISPIHSGPPSSISSDAYQYSDFNSMPDSSRQTLSRENLDNHNMMQLQNMDPQYVTYSQQTPGMTNGFSGFHQQSGAYGYNSNHPQIASPINQQQSVEFGFAANNHMYSHSISQPAQRLQTPLPNLQRTRSDPRAHRYFSHHYNPPRMQAIYPNHSQPLPDHRRSPVGASDGPSDVASDSDMNSLAMSTLSLTSILPTHEDLASHALSRPGDIKWAAEQSIFYDTLDIIELRSVVFKKKVLSKDSKTTWTMFEKIRHRQNSQYGRDGLRVGDWLIGISGSQAPFSGVTAWFRNAVAKARDNNQSLKFTVRRPESLLTDLTDTDSVNDAYSVNTERPRMRRPTISSNNSDMEPAHNLTLDPEIQERGRKKFDDVRKSLLGLPIEKLGRCRLLFHEIVAPKHRSSNLCRDLQYLVIDEHHIITPADALRRVGHDRHVRESHTHVTLCEGGSTFSAPGGCVDGRETCDHEKQDLAERTFQHAAFSRGDDVDQHVLISMNPQIKSGTLFMSDLQRASTIKGLQMHVEVLSLYNIDSETTKTWFSPLLYCKHSLNIVLIDKCTFSDTTLYNDLELQLSRLLSEISRYSRDFVADRERDHKLMGKVLLVIADSHTEFNNEQEENIAKQNLKKQINAKIPNQEMLITSNGYPFVLYSGRPSEASNVQRVLFDQLKNMAEKGLGGHKYPRAAIEVAQVLHERPGEEMIEKQDVELILNQLESPSQSDDPNREPLITGTLSYLHNTGQAYVPALSYSESIGKSEPGFKHSILMQPFRIMSYYDLLRLPNDFTRRIRETGVTTIEELKRLFQLYSKIDTGKLIDVLSELHIVLRDYKTGDEKNLSIPVLMQPRQPGGLINSDIRAITNQSNKFPSFVLTYQTDNQCFMLAASFLQQLALEAHKRHGSSDLNLNSLQGTFDLFGHTVRVCPATLTSWECSDWRDSDTEKSAAMAQRNLCFYTNSSTTTTKDDLAYNLQKIVNRFHEKFPKETLPVFGNPCPLEDKCTKRPFHVIDFTCKPTCSGIDLSSAFPDMHNPGMMSRGGDEQVRMSKKEEILNRPAHDLPIDTLSVLDEYRTLERNWVGIARKEQFNQSQIDKLGAADSPTYTMLRDLDVRGGFTIRHLLARLAEMENIESIQLIGSWIDGEMKKL